MTPEARIFDLHLMCGSRTYLSSSAGARSFSRLGQYSCALLMLLNFVNIGVAFDLKVSLLYPK